MESSKSIVGFIERVELYLAPSSTAMGSTLERIVTRNTDETRFFTQKSTVFRIFLPFSLVVPGQSTVHLVELDEHYLAPSTRLAGSVCGRIVSQNTPICSLTYPTCPQAEITFFADIQELHGILQMKNLRGQFLLNIERDDRTKRSVPMTNFVVRNVSNLRFAGERRDAQRFLVIFFLIELKNVRAEVIPIDQSGLLGIEPDDERSSFIRFDDLPCRTISLIDCRID